MMMLLKLSVLATLLCIALAQTGVSIEDMLKDSSHPLPAPAPMPPVPLQELAPGGSHAPVQSVQQPDTSSSVGAPAPFPTSPTSAGGGGSSGGDSMAGLMKGMGDSGGGGGGMGGMGAVLGALAGAGGAKSQKPDMFGRKPSSNPLGDLLGGGGGGGGGAAHKSGPMNPIMSTLLKSVEARMPMNVKNAHKLGAQPAASGYDPAVISQQSKDIVAGLVTAFMHNVELLPGEKACLENNIATVVFDIVGAASDLAKAIKAIMATKNATEQAEKSKSQGTMVSAGLDGAMKVTSLVTMATSLLKDCVQGDALEMLKAVGRHFINMQYVGHRLLISGVDIAHRLSDGVVAYEHQDWHRFGKDIGVALRQILLSNATEGSRLPEGVPEQAIIEQTTAGLMSGFFVQGSGVEITDSASPDVDIQLDLHRCVAGNHEFFKEVWMAMWNLIAQLSMTADGSMTNPFDDVDASGAQPKWMGELMVAMMQVPVALSRCNIGQDSQQMLMEAVKSIKYVHVHFLFPKRVITADEAAQRMAKAVSAWTNWDFKGFGRQIGKMLRKFVLLMYPQGGSTYPQQYSVDASGRLRRQLIVKSSPLENIKVAGVSGSPALFASVGAGVVSSMLVAMVAVRGMRSMCYNDERRDASGADREGGSDTDDLEVE